MILHLGATSAQAAESRQVRVGVLSNSPPFSYQAADGTWKGLAVELWHLAADALHLQYELQGMDRVDLMASVAQGKLDFAIGPISITGERLAQMDFSTPYFVTGLAIAVPYKRSRLAVLVDNTLSPTFLKFLGPLIACLMVVGALFWLFERRQNPAQFGGPHLHGFGSGFWLAAVTMSTVGYGDKSPKTLAGRVLAVIWMFISIILVAAFTGMVASILTADRLAPTIKGPDDLHGVRVVSVEGSAAAAILQKERIVARLFPTVQEALQALVDGRADALASDRALLKYQLKENPDMAVSLVPGSFFPEFYAFAMPLRTPDRKLIDQAMSDVMESPRWPTILFEYIGNYTEHLRSERRMTK